MPHISIDCRWLQSPNASLLTTHTGAAIESESLARAVDLYARVCCIRTLYLFFCTVQFTVNVHYILYVHFSNVAVFRASSKHWWICDLMQPIRLAMPPSFWGFHFRRRMASDVLSSQHQNQNASLRFLNCCSAAEWVQNN